MPTPLIIAHRGASAFAPENTLAAFELAIKEGSDGIEFDVRLARDGVPVVIHDATLRRVAGLRKSVKNLTSTELAKIDVGSSFNRRHPNRAKAEYSSEGVPTLERTLEFLRNFSGLVYLEIKCDLNNAERIANAIADTAGRASCLPNLIVQSFNLEAIRHVKSRLPDTRTAALFGPQLVSVIRGKRRLRKIALEVGANHLSLHRTIINRIFMENARALGITVTVWTTDDPRWLSRARQLGIFALITNDPRSMRTGCKLGKQPPDISLRL